MKLTHDEMERCGVRFVLDLLHPHSPYGCRKLNRLQPFAPKDSAELQQELDNIQRMLAARPGLEKTFARLEQVFTQIKDIRQTLRRCGEGAALDEVELFEIKRYLLQLRQAAALFGEIDATARFENLCIETIDDALAILDIDKSGVASFSISERYSPALAAARRKKREVEQQLRQAESEAEHDELARQRGEAVATEQAEEARIRADLSAQLAPHAPKMLHNTREIAALDLLMEKAALAAKYTLAKPRVGGDVLCFTGMTNPMVAEALAQDGRSFTPVDIRLEKGAAVITGANMGGKSVALKTLALNTWLAQCGFYVFAAGALCPLFDSLWLVSDELEDVSRGLSSFGGEMVRLNTILAKPAGDFALVLLDEFARGTNPQEGTAIARAVAEYLNKRQDIAVMTTHFEGVAGYAHTHYQVAGLAKQNLDKLSEKLHQRPISERVDAIARLMDYRLLPVENGEHLPHDALAICRLLGIEDDIVAEIEKKLLTINNS